ncbi:MAG: DNA-3-methyladenine glycosylase [Verrucomicrobiota bacterium]
MLYQAELRSRPLKRGQISGFTFVCKPSFFFVPPLTGIHAVSVSDRRNSHLPLPPSFYEAGADVVASALLGHYLLRRTDAGVCGGMIVETEAYLADDPACHAFGGETSRNRAMFGLPGRAYVYLIYGMHHCVNAVCRPRGVGEAVLIRALAPVFGLEQMQARRPVLQSRELTNGPAKLCAALQIDRELDAVNICDARSLLFIAKNASRSAALRRWGPIAATPRIGITKAAHLPLRYLLAGSECVSRKAILREPFGS